MRRPGGRFAHFPRIPGRRGFGYAPGYRDGAMYPDRRTLSRQSYGQLPNKIIQLPEEG